VSRRLFALDHNFPQPMLAAMVDALPQVELVPVRDIDPTFSDLADWELLRELHRDERPWDGMVTNDDAMLSLAKEMTVLSQTGLTLVVARGEGHNPIRAVGTLLCHLAHICHHTKPNAAQIWNLKVSQKSADPAQTYLDKIALRAKTTAARLFSENKLSPGDLQRR
jgi:hypothetical protein